MKSQVALVKCADYQSQNVKASLNRGIGLLGGLEALLPPGQSTLLKPNFLTAETPDKCVTTHPAVFGALAEILQPYCGKLTYGDSPAIQSMEAVAAKSGVAAEAARLNIAAADFKHGEEVFFDQGRQNRKFVIAKGVLEADQLISVSKLKTHAFARMTGAIKNQFGCIPGVLKAEFHARLPELEQFSQMLIDLNCCLKPALYVMDGIWAMEGNGPKNGKPKFIGLLLISQDPVALDATVCRILGLDPALIPSLRLGKQAGLGNSAEDEIELLGDPLATFYSRDFDIERRNSLNWLHFLHLYRRPLVNRPALSAAKCNGCGLCHNICPAKPKAISRDADGKPLFDYDKCISCFCCQETCPAGAVQVHRSLLRKIIRL